MLPQDPTQAATSEDAIALHDGFPLLASSFESTAEEWNPAQQNHPVRCGIVTLHVRREPLDSLRDEKEQSTLVECGVGTAVGSGGERAVVLRSGE